MDSVGVVKDAVEAGADAMLEVLKKEGEARHFNCDDSCNHQRGWLVFIPVGEE